MRKILPLFAAAAICSGFVMAAEPVTITGEGKCAKCALKETDTCQNAIVVDEGGKSVTYYLAKNDVAKAYHKNVCQTTAKTTATGEVSEKDGKKILTATSIKKAE